MHNTCNNYPHFQTLQICTDNRVHIIPIIQFQRDSQITQTHNTLKRIYVCDIDNILSKSDSYRRREFFRYMYERDSAFYEDSHRVNKAATKLRQNIQLDIQQMIPVICLANAIFASSMKSWLQRRELQPQTLSSSPTQRQPRTRDWSWWRLFCRIVSTFVWKSCVFSQRPRRNAASDLAFDFSIAANFPLFGGRKKKWSSTARDSALEVGAFREKLRSLRVFPPRTIFQLHDQFLPVMQYCSNICSETGSRESGEKIRPSTAGGSQSPEEGTRVFTLTRGCSHPNSQLIDTARFSFKLKVDLTKVCSSIRLSQ